MGLHEDAIAAYEDHHAHQKAEVREERIKLRARIAREAPGFLRETLGVDAEITSWFSGVRNDERDGAVFDIDGVKVVYWRRQYTANSQALYLLVECPLCGATVPRGGPIWNLYYLGQALVEGSVWSHDCSGLDHQVAGVEERLVGALREYIRHAVETARSEAAELAGGPKPQLASERVGPGRAESSAARQA